MRISLYFFSSSSTEAMIRPRALSFTAHSKMVSALLMRSFLVLIPVLFIKASSSSFFSRDNSNWTLAIVMVISQVGIKLRVWDMVTGLYQNPYYQFLVVGGMPYAQAG